MSDRSKIETVSRCEKNTAVSNFVYSSKKISEDELSYYIMSILFRSILFIMLFLTFILSLQMPQK